MGSDTEFHFIEKRSLSLTSKRDPSFHKRVLDNEASIKSIEQHKLIDITKRGYKSREQFNQLNNFQNYNSPSDPDFVHQWYIVSYPNTNIFKFFLI